MTKKMQISEMESVADCLRDEKAAKQQLSTVWGSTSRPILDRCKGEVLFSLGTRSYLDLYQLHTNCFRYQIGITCYERHEQEPQYEIAGGAGIHSALVIKHDVCSISRLPSPKDH